jgi:flagellar motility protein MotE (MotC chaperone)
MLMRSSERRCRVAAALALALATAGARAEDARPAASGTVPCASAGLEPEGFLATIRVERAALERREHDVRARERGLAETRQETERRIAELDALRVQVEDRIARLESATDERVAQLADLYGRMPTERAASVLASLDPDLAARIVGRMRRARGAAVLAALPGPRAAELSRRLLKPPAVTTAQNPLAQAAERAADATPATASVP